MAFWGDRLLWWECPESASDFWILGKYRPDRRFRSENGPPRGSNEGNWRQHGDTPPASCARDRQFTQNQVPLEMRRRWVAGGKAGRDNPGFFRSLQADGSHTRFAFAFRPGQSECAGKSSFAASGIIRDLQAAEGATPPWYLTRLNRGGGTNAASFLIKSRESKIT
jgi:hypothetical protein